MSEILDTRIVKTTTKVGTVRYTVEVLVKNLMYPAEMVDMWVTAKRGFNMSEGSGDATYNNIIDARRRKVEIDDQIIVNAEVVE